MTTQYQNKDSTFTPKKEDELKHKQDQDKYGSHKEKEIGTKKTGGSCGTCDKH